MEHSKNEGATPLDNVFVIYPRHLEWLMQEHKLNVSEICVALGLPSMQEWYKICRNPEQPVRNLRVVQNARLYLRTPSLLPSSYTPLQELIERTHVMFGDDLLTHRLLEALFHKQWGTIEGWLSDDETSIDLSARRLTRLLMDLDDNDFQTAILDAAVSTRAQVKAEEIEVMEINGTAERLYVSPVFGKMTIRQALEIIPTPGRRIAKTDYVVPTLRNHQFQSQVADAKMRHSNERASDGLSPDAMKALSHTPWRARTPDNKDENDGL